MASFEDYSKEASRLYNEIRDRCIAQGGDKAWELEKKRWKDVVVRANHVEEDSVLPPDAENEEAGNYIKRVITQQNGLVRHYAVFRCIALILFFSRPKASGIMARLT